MHTIRNGVLSYGLMNVPVGVCTAASRKEKVFKTLHRDCLLPIKSPKMCPACQLENLSSEDTVSGFEFTKGNFVVVDPEVMENITPERSEVIRIKKCITYSDLDELYVDKSYVLKPASVLARPYQLLANALGEKEAVGLGSAALWGKEHPIMIYSRESGVLVMSMLYCHDELADADVEVPSVFGLVPEEEQELANIWVATMIRDFNPQEDLATAQRKLTDEYLASLIQEEKFTLPSKGPEPMPTVDVLETLRASVEQARTVV